MKPSFNLLRRKTLDQPTTKIKQFNILSKMQKKTQINKNKLYLIVTPEFSNKESITNLLLLSFRVHFLLLCTK